MTNTPDKSEMKALERVERRLNNTRAKHGFMTLTVSDLREVVSLARASSRPADQVPDMVEWVARALCEDNGDDPDDLDNSRICKADGTPLPLWAAYESAAIAALQAVPAEVGEVREALRSEIINSPETADFMAGVPIEAAHQRERWGSDHDAGKTPFDWFWLVGYLAQKAAGAAVAGDNEKAQHHTISTAAALANWHAALTGANVSMRPGIDAERERAWTEDEPWLCRACNAANLAIRKQCRFCKQHREDVAVSPCSVLGTSTALKASGEE